MSEKTKLFQCESCGHREFVSVYSNRKLCTECKKVFRKVQQKRYDSTRQREVNRKLKPPRTYICIHCGEQSIARNRGGALPKYCDDCRKNYTFIYESNFRIRGPIDSLQRKKIRAKYRYGISGEAYDQLVALQNGKCAVCEKAPDRAKVLYVDHDHSCCPGEQSCGKCLRGLLCQHCNSALGLARDSVDILKAMSSYLGSGGAKSSPNYKRKYPRKVLS